MLLDVMVSTGQKEKVVVTLDLIQGGVQRAVYMILTPILTCLMQKPHC